MKVGLPGAKEGLFKEDPTIAELLKPLGYATAQFGKNHLGDLDEHLPSNHGFDVWQEPLVTLRFPKLINLRRDPFERADHETMGYDQWRAERMFALAPGADYVGKFLGPFKEFPTRQKPGSLNLDHVLESLEDGKGTTN